MALWLTITLIGVVSIATILLIGWLCFVALMFKALDDSMHMADGE